MSSRRLFAVGDLCMDIITRPAARPAPGEERSLESLDVQVGGSAANFSVVAAKLGLHPVLISATGNDFAAPLLRRSLSASGVRPILVRTGKRSSFSLVSVSKSGGRSIQSINNCLDELSIPDVRKRIITRIRPGDIVFVGGFYHMKKLRNGFESLLAEIRSRGGIVMFDTCQDTSGRWGINKLLPFIDVLFANKSELSRIAPGRSLAERAKYLLKRGAGLVVIKKGESGAAAFSRWMTKPLNAGPLEVKAADTTGAGDAFNAGYAYGLTKGWSAANCCMSGNFVAAEKIKSTGFTTPRPEQVDRFIERRNKPQLIIAGSYDEMSSLAACLVSEHVKRGDSIALPTGRTPVGLYRKLASMHMRGLDFSRSRFFALDEYVGLSRTDKNSFSFFLERHLLGRVNANRRNVHLLNGSAREPEAECSRHERAIQRHGIGLCILGIGRNGHVAFNEPGSPHDSDTRVVRLTDQTREVNGSGFASGMAPPMAMTVGLGTIIDNSRSILLLASGKSKSKAIRDMIKSGKSKKSPAMALLVHPDVTVITDKQAAGLLR